MIQLDDVIKVSDQKSMFNGYKGIIKSICKSCIFLYEPALLKTSFGIFAEQPRNVRIQGSELFSNQDSFNNSHVG